MHLVFVLGLYVDEHTNLVSVEMFLTFKKLDEIDRYFMKCSLNRRLRKIESIQNYNVTYRLPNQVQVVRAWKLSPFYLLT